MSSRRKKSRGGAARSLIASMLTRLRRGQDMRTGKVRRVRGKLRDESYFNLLKLDIAAQRLADELIE
jgi:hypothetical protein